MFPALFLSSAPSAQQARAAGPHGFRGRPDVNIRLAWASLPTCLAVPRLVHIRRRFSIDGGAGLPDVYRCAALSLDD